MSSIERGERNASVLTLQALMTAMGMTMAQLFEELEKE
jgi:transcriptional regulator with XRE-family HTH domain